MKYGCFICASEIDTVGLRGVFYPVLGVDEVVLPPHPCFLRAWEFVPF